MVGGWGGVCTVIFMSNPTVVLRLGWGWGFDNFNLTELGTAQPELVDTYCCWTYMKIIFTFLG